MLHQSRGSLPPDRHPKGFSFRPPSGFQEPARPRLRDNYGVAAHRVKSRRSERSVVLTVHASFSAARPVHGRELFSLSRTAPPCSLFFRRRYFQRALDYPLRLPPRLSYKHQGLHRSNLISVRYTVSRLSSPLNPPCVPSERRGSISVICAANNNRCFPVCQPVITKNISYHHPCPTNVPPTCHPTPYSPHTPLHLQKSLR